MTVQRLHWTITCIVACCLLAGCRTIRVPSNSRQPMTLAGTVAYEDGSPGRGALIAITNLETGKQAAVLTAGNDGRFQLALAAGDYAFAVTSDRGFAWIAKQSAPNTSFNITLSRSCRTLTGHVDRRAPSTRVNLVRKSTSTGDTFVTRVRPDSSFTMCLPEAHYSAFLTGETVSLAIDVSLSLMTDIKIEGFANNEVRRAPRALGRIPADLAGLVADISLSAPTIIGLGEATHGTSEFFSTRGELTLELVKQVGVRLVLLEIDAIGGVALDDYINGVDLDIEKAVAALGFWVTDTYEFLRFLALIRQYNKTSSDKVHIWGIDLQNTTLPANVLLTNSAALAITADEQTVLKVAATKRGKSIADLTAAQRLSLDALLSRLGAPQSPSREDLLISVAARSLATQLGYWDGDMVGEYRRRRDSGMASLVSFLVSQLGKGRACLWAHAGHISKSGNNQMMGHFLSLDPSFRYYGIGFYIYQGYARAWDGAAKIGVISHPIPVAPIYTVEGAIMTATGMPETAWVPLHKLDASFLKWLKIPRFVRELGSQYVDNEDTMTLRNIPDAFDALVVIKTGHASSPTPTGVREVTHE